MTAPTCCDWIDDITGERCTEIGTEQSARWSGCKCELHGEAVAMLGRGLVLAVQDLAQRGRELLAKEAA